MCLRVSSAAEPRHYQHSEQPHATAISPWYLQIHSCGLPTVSNSTGLVHSTRSHSNCNCAPRFAACHGRDGRPNAATCTLTLTPWGLGRRHTGHPGPAAHCGGGRPPFTRILTPLKNTLTPVAKSTVRCTPKRPALVTGVTHTACKAGRSGPPTIKEHSFLRVWQGTRIAPP